MTAFSWPDYAVLAIYAGVVIGVGLWAGRRERDTHDYFLGGRRQHWLVACLSLLATEISALTFVSVPGGAFGGDCRYLQFYVGSVLARLAIAAFLLPAFYGGQVTTVYEYLGQRFGPWTRTTATLFFFASRLLGSGYRLLACCVALWVVTGWPLEWIIAGTVLAVLVYTTFGGIKAVMFTDVVQALLILGGPMLCIAFLLQHLEGTAFALWSAAAEAGKLHVFHFTLDLRDETGFYLIVVHSFFQTFAALGTDQDLTQRLLTCPDLRRSRRSLLVNAVAVFPIVCMFLALGVLLYLYYQKHADAALPSAEDKVFAHFIVTVLPAGLKGMLIAGLLAASMGSLDSALQSLATSAVVDLVRPWRGRKGERQDLRLARLFVVFFGVVLAGLTIYFAQTERFQQLIYKAFAATSIVFGPMVGVFLVAISTRSRGQDRANVLAMLSAIAVLVFVKANVPSVAWLWYIVIGAAWTCGVSLAFRTPGLSDDRDRA